MDGKNHFAALPVAFYGGVLMAAAIAYYILCRTLIAYEGRDSALAIAVGRDWKGKISVAYYARHPPGLLEFVVSSGAGTLPSP